jgi:hypothetical protein
MSERKQAVRMSLGARSPQRTPRQNRVWRFLWLTLGTGATVALLALFLPPFIVAGQGLIDGLLNPRPSPVQIPASAIFPSVPPTHKAIDVYDPPPKPAKASPTAPSPGPSPTSRWSPRPTPTPDD